MAGSLIISMPVGEGTPGVSVSIGGDWYARVVDGARRFFPSGSEHYVEKIYGAGDASGEDWADLSTLSEEEFNVFCQAIIKSIEHQMRELFDKEGRPWPTVDGTPVDHEILTKLKSDARYDVAFIPSK